MSKDFNAMAPWGMMARCVMNPDLSIAYFLDPEDSNLRADSTEIDWDEVEELGQNVMVQIPKYYSIKKKVGDSFYFGASESPVADNFVEADEWAIDDAFYRDRTKLCDDQSAEPVEVEHRYMGAFAGWVDGKGRLRSLPFKEPSTDISITDFRGHAKNMGVGWTQLDYNLLKAIQMLYISEFGHPDSQTMVGKGWTSQSAKTDTGGTMEYGNNTFGETTGKKQMSYRGIEDLWGNVRNWVDGFVLNRPSQGDLSIANKGFNSSGEGYTKVANSPSALNGNIRHIQDDPRLGFVPQEIGGANARDGLYDYGGLDVGSSANFPYCGGTWNHAANAGAFYFLASYSASYSYVNVGARLCA